MVLFDCQVDNNTIRQGLIEHVIKPVIPSHYLDKDTKYFLNPSGRFVIGGPQGDAGLTGRKIIVDSYGGWGAHGGGAFSGKDPSKVDRSAAYAARWIAKSLVAAKLCRRYVLFINHNKINSQIMRKNEISLHRLNFVNDSVLVQISYAIGIAEPMSLYVHSYGTGTKSDAEILEVLENSKLKHTHTHTHTHTITLSHTHTLSCSLIMRFYDFADCSKELRFASWCDHSRLAVASPDLREDSVLWSLWSQRSRFHLGKTKSRTYTYTHKFSCASCLLFFKEIIPCLN
jgi:hypothetical protein